MDNSSIWIHMDSIIMDYMLMKQGIPVGITQPISRHIHIGNKSTSDIGREQNCLFIMG